MHLIRTLLTAGTLASAALAQTLVAPNGYATSDGNTSNSFPWGNTTTNTHIQFVYDTSNFTLQGVNYPIIINRLRFRADAVAATTSWTGGTWSNVRIDMGPAAVDYLAVTNTWTTNRSAGVVTVHNGAVVQQAGAGNGAGVPGPWYMDVPLSTPLAYDPSLGADLLLDILKDGTGWTGTTRLPDHVSGTGGPSGPPLSSRVYATGTTALTVLTGTVATNYGIVVEFSYTPASGLYAGFTASPTTGASPLNVQFTDTSFSSAPGGITSWAWDFNNDNVIDSTVQNPLHIYTSCGTYSVRLTVTDSTFPQSSVLRTNLVVVDALTANFTASPLMGQVPLPVQFTDTSTGTVTSWAWDFDNDSVTDSTLQNPLHTYVLPGVYSVKLTVSNPCFNHSVTQTNLVTVVGATSNTLSPSVLELQFNEVRGQSVANTASTTLLPSHATVSSANWQGDPGRPFFKGNEAGAGMLAATAGVQNLNLVNTAAPLTVNGNMTIMWWQRATGTPPSTAYPFGGTGTPGCRIFTGGAASTHLRYTGPITIDGVTNVQTMVGWNHIALVINDAAGTGTWYHNGVADPAVAFTANTHTMAIAELHVGYHTATTSTYTAWYDMDDFRIYSSALTPAQVMAASTSENPTTGTWGTSCAGPGGTPVMSANSAPALGTPGFQFQLSNAEASRLTALVLGLQPRTFGPVNLAWLLGAGCQLEVDWVSATFYVTSGSGTAQQNLGIPNNPIYKGMHVYGQWLIAGTSGAATRAIDVNVE